MTAISADQDLDPATGQYNTDTALTNQFSYQQNVYSLYNSWQFKTSGWTFKAGIRAEQTDINSSFTQSQTQIAESTKTI